MSRGVGTRMVVELNLDLKRNLYAELAREGLTFKQWLTQEAERYVHLRQQRVRKVAEPASSMYTAVRKPRTRSGS